MSISDCGNALLQEHTVDRGVFAEMDRHTFHLSDSEKFALSVRFQFPKFSKGYTVDDFEPFIIEHIGLGNVVSLGRLCFPNEWQMQVNSKEIREKLIRIGRTKICARTCWISPLSQSEVRGYVHWIPSAIQNSFIQEILVPYGEVVFIENQKQTKWKKIDSDSRYFALNLKPGKVVDDIPHFIKIQGSTGLITIKGRNPCCFHCREVGHRKSECKKYREKLSDYNSRKPNELRKRTKPRGRRHRPEQVASIIAAAEIPQGAKPKVLLNQQPVPTTKNKKKKNKANKNEEKAKLEETTNKGEDGNVDTVNVEVSENNIPEEGANSFDKTLDLDKMLALLPSDSQIKRRLVLLEDFTSILNDEGSSIHNKLTNFRQKWYPEDDAANSGVPVTSVSPLDAADVQNEKSAPDSEGKKKKKKKKKKKNKSVQ